MLVEEFYADPERAGSEEVGFGSSWRTQGQGPWKVIWLKATGELVAFEEASPAPYVGQTGGGGLEDLPFSIAIDVAAAALRHTEHRPKPPGHEVVIIGIEPDLLRLRGALIGWEEHLPEENGLAWLAERIDELSRRPER